MRRYCCTHASSTACGLIPKSAFGQVAEGAMADLLHLEDVLHLVWRQHALLDEQLTNLNAFHACISSHVTARADNTRPIGLIGVIEGRVCRG